MKRRVVITGMHAVTPLGNDWATVRQGMENGVSGVRYMAAWEDIPDLSTRLGAPTDFSTPKHWGRRQTRSMGRVAAMAVDAAEQALEDAGLKDDPVLRSGRAGVACGSCSGSTDAIQEFSHMLSGSDTSRVNATTYIRLMGHTAPVNIAVFFGIRGRIINSSSACTSGSQGIGFAYEAIRHGQQDVMLAGGAEELCPSQAAIFDTLFATSVKNNTPTQTPRPFDRDRDGLVVGEGAGIMVLESLEHARARGARIHAEILGFATNCDGDHITQPNQQSMGRVMQLALDDAELEAGDIQYINGHGTGTQQGDVAESNATHALFGGEVPFSTMKGHVGHTLGGCGAIETWATIRMMRDGWLAPTLNLENIDADCAALDYVTGSGRQEECQVAMCNNFAFGGINTSLIVRYSRGLA